MRQCSQTGMIAATSFRPLTIDHLFNAGHLQSPTVGIVIPGLFKNRLKTAPAFGGDFVIGVVAPTEAILAGSIQIVFIGDVFPQTVSCVVLEAGHDAIVRPAVEIDTLISGDLCDIAHKPHA